MLDAIKRFFKKLFGWKDVDKSVDVKRLSPKKKEVFIPLGSYHRNRAYYKALYNSMKINKSAGLDFVVTKINASKKRYEEAGYFCGIDWRVVAGLHLMETGLNFQRQILNGEPWNKTTTMIPKNRGPWDSWVKSCDEALRIHNFKGVTDLVDLLKKFERHNGLGYVRKGIHSPYLWAGSSHYSKGKFVRDGGYDSKAVSEQIGVAVIMKKLGMSIKYN